MPPKKLRVNSGKLGRNDDFKPGVGNIDNWQNGASQIQSFFDSVLDGNPSWENGLHQLQDANPSWARGAEQLGSFFTGRPQRRIGGRGPAPAGNTSRAGAGPRPSHRPAQQPQPMPMDMGPEGNGLSFADYLRQAEEMLGGMGSVNYDPERNALRTNNSNASNIMQQIYADLQQQFANSAPQIQQRYAQTGEGIDQNTAQAANAVNSSNTDIREEQTRQLGALGIEDAIANVAPQQAADQANAISGIQQQGQIAGNANDAFGATAGTYNSENQATAGMEGASKQALLQAQLLAGLAGIDSRETDANAQLANQRQGSAMSIAQMLMQNDPEGAQAVSAQAQSAAEAAQQQFENEARMFELNGKYGQPQQAAAGAGGMGNIQQVLALLQSQGVDMANADPKVVSQLLGAYSKYF